VVQVIRKRMKTAEEARTGKKIPDAVYHQSKEVATCAVKEL
jgi:hypothetical protein